MSTQCAFQMHALQRNCHCRRLRFTARYWRKIPLKLQLKIGKKNVFSWFKKKKEKFTRIKFHEEEYLDDLEKCLWEIKDEYDLPTEEIVNVVQSKRKNLDRIHKILAKKNK